MATTGNTATDVAHETEEVLIFYSSKTEPQLLDMYAEPINYLHSSDITTTIVDVEESRDLVHEYEVVATPLVIVKCGEETERYLGVVDGLKTVLEENLYGRSLLHQLGFKEGRQFARQHDLADADRDMIEREIGLHMRSQGADSFGIESFDRDISTAKGWVEPDQDSDDTSAHDQLEEFLGGCFTEIFGTGVMGTEIQCVKDGYDHCKFTVKKQNE